MLLKEVILLKSCYPCNAKEGLVLPRGQFFDSREPLGGNRVRPGPVVLQASERSTSMVTIQHPGHYGGAECAAQVQQRHYDPLQKSHTSKSSTGIQHSEPEDCTLQSNRHKVRGEADAVLSAPKSFVLQYNATEISPLLYRLLKENPATGKTIPSSSLFLSGKPDANMERQRKTDSSVEKGPKCLKGERLLVPSNCEQSRAPTQNRSTAAHSVSIPTKFPCSSGSGGTPVDKSSQENTRSPPNKDSDAEIKKLIETKIAKMKASWSQSDHNMQNLTHFPCHSRTFASDSRDVPKQIHNSAFSAQSTRAGQVFIKDGSKYNKANPTLTSKPDDIGHGSASMRHSKGTPTSSVEHLGPGLRCSTEHLKPGPSESVDTSVTVDLELPVQICCKKNDNVKCIHFENCEDKIFSSGNVYKSAKYSLSDQSTIHYTLTALKELMVSLENVDTFSQMDNFVEVLLQNYWNGDRDNVHLFASTEYLKIMCEVAATCQKHEEESPVVLTALSPSLDAEEQKTCSNVKENASCTDPRGGISIVCKHIPSEDKEDAGLTNLSAFERLQGCHTSSKQVPSQSKTIDQNVNMITSNQREKLMLHSTRSHGFGKNVKFRGQDPPSVCERTVSVSVVKDPQYEDVSDKEDSSPLDIQQSSAEHKNSDFQAPIEDISDDESPSAVITSEENDILPSGHTDKKMMISSDEQDPETAQTCSPYLVETDTGFETVPCPSTCANERNLERPINGSQNCSSASEVEEEWNKDLDDWLVIPLHSCGIELVNEENIDRDEVLLSVGEQDLTSELHLPPTSPEPGSASPPPVVFHTCEWDTSSETEDSCDYTSSPERNYLTVSRQALSLAASSPSKRNHPKSPKGNKEIRLELNRGKIQRRPKTSSKKRKSNIDSDTDDEKCDKRAKLTNKTRLTFSHSALNEPSSFNSHWRLTKESHCENMIEIITDTETDDDICEVKVIMPSSELLNADSSLRAQQKEEYKITAQELEHCQGKPQDEQSEMQTASLEASDNSESNDATAKTEPTQQNNTQMESKSNVKSYRAKQDPISEMAKATTERMLKDSSVTEDSEDVFSETSDSSCVKESNDGKVIKANASPEHSRQIQNSLIASKKKILQKGHSKKRRKKRRLSLEMDSEESASDSHSTRKKIKNDRRSHKKPQKKHPQSADGTVPHSGQSHIVSRLYIGDTLQASDCLKLSEQSAVHRKVQERKARATTNTPVATSTKSPLNKEQIGHLSQDEAHKFVSKPSASSNFPHSTQAPKCRPSISRPKRLSHSYRHSPTSDIPSTSSNNCSLALPLHSSAKRKVMDMWGYGYHPIPRHRKASLGTRDDSTTKNVNPGRETIPGPSQSTRCRRQRRRSSKSETPLMKRTKSQATQRRRDIKFNPTRQQSHVVADHYKWRNRGEGSETTGLNRRRRRYSSPPSLDQWK